MAMIRVLVIVLSVITFFSCEQNTGNVKSNLDKDSKNNKGNLYSKSKNIKLKNKKDAEFYEFIPEGYSILFQETCDLNLDSILDKILILNKIGEDSLSTNENPINREFLILLGQKNKSFKLEMKNSNLIYYYSYDLNFKDAFVNLIVKPGQFSINHYGGFAQRWGRSTTFKYNLSEKNLFLFEDCFYNFDATDPENTTKENILTEKDFGRISFEKFNIYYESK